MRILAGIVLLALVGLVLFKVMGPSPKAAPTPEGGFVNSQQCMECHPQVFEEWAGSQHSQSWINPEVRDRSGDFSNTDCIDCHAPQDLFATGPGKRALPRADRRADGVDCLSCHRIPEEDGGGMAGTLTNTQAACRPQVRRELARAEFCGSCHNQHQTVDQWQASRFAQPGPDYKDCRDCHMPPRTGAGAMGRSHSMHGGHDMELIRSGLRFDAQRDATEPARILVELENHTIGHAYPTDERSRASDIFWRVTPSDPDATGDWQHLYRIRDPYRHEVDLPRTLVDAGETLRVDLMLPTEAQTKDIQVALYYKRSPHYRDPKTGEARPIEEVRNPLEDAKLVFQVSVPKP